MNEDLKQYEKKIKKIHRISWTPKYEEETRTSLNPKLVIPIIIKTFEKLGWEVLYRDENIAEAKRKLGWNDRGTKISVSHHFGKLIIKSESLGSEIWDNGQNSKRVKLFIHAFQQTEKTYDRKSLAELEKEVEKTNNWDDYVIPESLPQPRNQKKPRFWTLIVCGLITALFMGFILALLSLKGFYLIFLFEVLVAIVLSYILQQLVKISNFTSAGLLNYSLIGIVVITYVSSQYFQYQIVLHVNNDNHSNPWEFLQARLEHGLTFNRLNLGWIGLLISWVLQFVITYYVAVFRLTFSLTAYRIKRVPVEVVDFAYYHFVKENTEKQVRAELSKMGWNDSQNQDEVLEAIDAIGYAQELNRIQ